MQHFRLSRLIGPATSVALLAGALFLLTRTLKNLSIAELPRALDQVPHKSVLLAIGLTALSYVALSIYDYMGVRFVGRRISFLKVALAAFTAYSISHSLGFPAVTGGTVRYRFYSRWGLSGVEVAQVMGMAGITLFLGMFEIAGVALLLDGARVQEWSDLPKLAINLLGVVSLGIVFAYGAAGWIWPDRFAIGRLKLMLPSPGFATLQIALSGMDWLLVSSVLYVLLPGSGLSYPVFLGVFTVAYLAGVLSNVPGGLGTFDSIIIVSLRDNIPTEAIVVSLLVYRAVYYLLPLTVGGLIFVIFEFARRPLKRGT